MLPFENTPAFPPTSKKSGRKCHIGRSENQVKADGGATEGAEADGAQVSVHVLVLPLQVDHEVLREDVEVARRSAARLQLLCPDRMHALDGEARATLRAWEKLGAAMAENRARLQNFVRLQDFFQNYLAMM